MTLPKRMSSGTIFLIVSTGTAKPTPLEAPDGETIIVFMPMSSPLEFEQRPARIAGVDRGVGLDHVADGDVARAEDLPAQGADDALGDRVIEAERIADGDDLLADLEIFGRADLTGERPFRSPWIWRTAMSLFSSLPTSLACRCSWLGSVTLNSTPSSITWKFVTMWPWSSQMNPDPLPLGTFFSLKYQSRTSWMFVMNTTRVLRPLDDVDRVSLVFDQLGPRRANHGRKRRIRKRRRSPIRQVPIDI